MTTTAIPGHLPSELIYDPILCVLDVVCSGDALSTADIVRRLAEVHEVESTFIEVVKMLEALKDYGFVAEERETIGQGRTQAGLWTKTYLRSNCDAANRRRMRYAEDTDDANRLLAEVADEIGQDDDQTQRYSIAVLEADGNEVMLQEDFNPDLFGILTECDSSLSFVVRPVVDREATKPQEQADTPEEQSTQLLTMWLHDDRLGWYRSACQPRTLGEWSLTNYVMGGIYAYVAESEQSTEWDVLLLDSATNRRLHANEGDPLCFDDALKLVIMLADQQSVCVVLPSGFLFDGKGN